MFRFNHIVIKLILVLCFIVSGCTNQKSKLSGFFNKIEKGIQDSELLLKIKSTPQDSLSKILPIFIAIYKHNFLKEKDYWYNINRDRFANLSEPLKNEILLLSFQKYLNNKEIDLDRIKIGVIEAYHNREEEKIKIKLKHENELKTIIEINNFSCKLGDTINIYLPLMGTRDYYTIFFDQYPSTLRYTLPDATLKMTGTLVSKFYDKRRTGIDSLENNHPFNLFFKIKITNISNKKSHVFGSKALQIGDIYDLPMNFYATQIKPLPH